MTLSCVPQVNYNLLTVNAFMAATGLYQLYRKVSLDYGPSQAAESMPELQSSPR